MVKPADNLETLVAAELAIPVDPRIATMAEAIAVQYGAASRAVLFYGSCLRTRELEGQMLDFYLIVSDYRAAYGKKWLATANRLIPPNVFPFAHDGLAAKYAVLSEDDLAALCGPDASAVSVWARFAQPSRLVWSSDAQASARAVASIAQAPRTLVALTPAQPDDDALAIWHRGFALTYSAELRAERAGRSGSIVDFAPDYYARLSTAMATDPPQRLSGLDRRWRRLRRNGKALTLVRLAKASLTFAGGIDYLAWKINRHAGTQLVIRPWQRRFPILGAITLLPRLFARGAVR